MGPRNGVSRDFPPVLVVSSPIPKSVFTASVFFNHQLQFSRFFSKYFCPDLLRVISDVILRRFAPVLSRPRGREHFVRRLERENAPSQQITLKSKRVPVGIRFRVEDRT